MTPEERAEKIARDIFSSHPYGLATLESWTERIAAQIREAQEEAYSNGYAMAHTDRDGGYKTGRASMREEAAKVADKYKSDRYSADTAIEAENMAREIRQLKSK